MANKITGILQGEDLFCPLADGRKICYRRFGNEEDEVLVLIVGLGLQLIYWPANLIELFVSCGYQVIVFDNRDVGRSSAMKGKPLTLLQMMFRRTNSDTYHLGDMADDLMHILNYLHIKKIHLVGMSMGGMIAQSFAVSYPERVISLTSIFSSTGALNVGQPNKLVRLAMLKKPTLTRTTWVKNYIRTARYIGSTKFPMPQQVLQAYAELAWERSISRSNEGVSRQIAAIIKSGDRTQALGNIKSPTLVIHGDKDPLVATSGGYATAQAIPDSHFVMIAGLGHFISMDAVPLLSDLIMGHMKRARNSEV